jgi:hypothetical protein
MGLSSNFWIFYSSLITSEWTFFSFSHLVHWPFVRLTSLYLLAFPLAFLPYDLAWSHTHQQSTSPTQPWQHSFQLSIWNSFLPLPLLSSTKDNLFLHVFFFNNKNTSLYFVKMYYFDYKHANYIGYSNYLNHCLTNFDHLSKFVQ